MKKDKALHLIDDAFARINTCVGEELNRIVEVIESQDKKEIQVKSRKKIRFLRAKGQKAFA